MIAAGLLAKKAVEKGLTTQALGQDQPRPRLEGGHRVPTTRPGSRPTSTSSASTSSATAAPPASATAARCRPRSRRRSTSATWSRSRCSRGNRNFEGRINSDVRANYLASPPLVVAYALAGTDRHRLPDRAARHRHGRQAGLPARHLADAAGGRGDDRCAPSAPRCSSEEYGDVFDGDEHWNGLDVPEGDTYAWDPDSTYVRNPPYFDDMPAEPAPVADIHGARVLARASATASRPTTSRRPARSRPTARPAST